MRRRRLTDEEKQQLTLVDNTSKPTWPVVHPEVLPPKAEPLLSSTSDETGGPLNANEAGRVMYGQSIRFAGHVFQSGRLHCRACSKWDQPMLADAPPGSGFRMSVYCGTSRDQVLGRCACCGTSSEKTRARRITRHHETPRRCPTNRAVSHHSRRSRLAVRGQASW